MKKNEKDYINTQVVDILDILLQKRITKLDKDRISAKVIAINQTVHNSK